MITDIITTAKYSEQQWIDPPERSIVLSTMEFDWQQNVKYVVGSYSYLASGHE